LERCPRCQSSALRRARTRNLVERVRKTLTGERPHRCRDCGWRGWAPERNPHADTPLLATQTPDFSAVDAELSGTTPAADAPAIEPGSAANGPNPTPQGSTG
jgi:hypothetical protein